MGKKKLEYGELQAWHFFILLFIVPFIFFFYMLSPNSYASIDRDIFNYCFDELYERNNIIPNNNYKYPPTNNTTLNNKLNDCNYFILHLRGNDGFIEFMLSSNPFYVTSQHGDLYYLNTGSYFTNYYNKNDFNYWGSSNFSVNSNSLDTYIFYGDVYTNNSYNNVLFEDNSNYITNSITLISSSHRKYTFNDFNQCNVYITGDWDFYYDFTFMLQRYIDDEWEDFAGSLDYLKLLDYENPYYVHWVNMNYYPAGTYRYRALLNDSVDTYFYSEPFQITSTFIENEGNVTGTYDNGNIDVDVTIDTGNTVDNIKDFLGQPATITDEDFSDNFPEVEVDDPSEDFFSWIFDQIENIFMSTSAQTLQFELFGTTYTYSSNDIYVPNNILKTMIGLSCDFSICFWIIKDVRKVINKIKEGNIEALADDDITANMV